MRCALGWLVILEIGSKRNALEASMYNVIRSNKSILVTTDVSRLANPVILFQSEDKGKAHAWAAAFFKSKPAVEAKPAAKAPEAISREAAIAARKEGLAQAAKTIRTARKNSPEWVKAVEYIERLSQ